MVIRRKLVDSLNFLIWLTEIKMNAFTLDEKKENR